MSHGYERAKKYRVYTRSIVLALAWAVVVIGSALLRTRPFSKGGTP